MTDSQACIYSTPLFRGILPSQAAQLASAARKQSYDKEQILFHEGDPLHQVFVIGFGCAKITQVTRNGKEIILRVDRRGDFLDDLEPSAPLHRVSAHAIESCQVLVWDVQTFASISHQNSIIYSNAMSIVSERLHSVEERFRDMTAERVPQRLARTLVHFFEKHPTSLSGAGIGLSHEELAQMTGTTHFTVCRLLSQWAAQGIIQPERKAIFIDNLEALREVAAAES